MNKTYLIILLNIVMLIVLISVSWYNHKYKKEIKNGSITKTQRKSKRTKR